MRKAQALAALLLLGGSAPAAAQGQDGNPGGVLMLFLIYGILAGSLLGWSVLVLLMAPGKVESAARSLAARPLACFVMGLLCCGWLLLSLGLARPLGRPGGLLVVLTLSVLVVCSLLGLPAILTGLGRRAGHALGWSSNALHEVAMGAVILFSAGSLPWLGWLLLAGIAVWACGGAVLSFLAGSSAAAAGRGPD